MISRKFLDKITDKWPVKVLSVAAALIISVFYRMNTLESRFFTVPLRIEYGNMPAAAALVPVSSYTHIIRVGLRGEATSIFHILEDDIEAFIDLSRFTNEGAYRIPVQFRKKGNALGVDPLEITVDPIEIHLRLENKVSRNINVSPVLQGTAAQGYELTSQSLFPASVIAEGPRSSMEAIYDFKTRTIDIEGRFENFSVIVNIINNDPLVIIHGNEMIEYRGTIQRIIREPQRDDSLQNIQDESHDLLTDEVEAGVDEP